jgi:hypothetical protein
MFICYHPLDDISLSLSQSDHIKHFHCAYVYLYYLHLNFEHLPGSIEYIANQ